MKVEVDGVNGLEVTGDFVDVVGHTLDVGHDEISLGDCIGQGARRKRGLVSLDKTIVSRRKDGGYGAKVNCWRRRRRREANSQVDKRQEKDIEEGQRGHHHQRRGQGGFGRLGRGE